MGRKLLYLIAALALPVAVFLFLKFFGKNEFAVEPLYQKSIPSTSCRYEYVTPYVVPDSVRAIMSPGNKLAVVFFEDRAVDDETGKLINRLKALFPQDPVSFHKMDENITLRKCVFFLDDGNSIVLLDGDGRIRGQYQRASMEEVDRLIVEMKIILRKF